MNVFNWIGLALQFIGACAICADTDYSGGRKIIAVTVLITFLLLVR